MNRFLVASCLLLVSACGGEVEVGVAATVRVDALLADEVTRFYLYVLGPQQENGILLSCEVLMSMAVRPKDPGVDRLAEGEAPFPPESSEPEELTPVASGKNRFVYVDAIDASTAIIANGCTDGVEVKPRKTTAVEVNVFRR